MRRREISVGGISATMFSGDGSDFALVNPDDLVGVKGGLKIYDEMRRDDAVGAFMQFRKWARNASGWKVIPASEDNIDKQVAAFIEFVLFRYMEPDIRTFNVHMMSAYDYGYSLAEKVWDRIDEGEYKGKWAFKKLAPKKPHAFKFVVDELGNLREQGIINIRPMGEDMPMSIDDFIHYPYASEFNNPYGSSDLRRAHTWWVMKKHIIRFQAIYFERLAGGFTDVSYDPELVEESEVDDMEEALESISVNTNLLHPSGFTVTIVESSGRGALSYDKAIQTFNSYNARTLLIPDLMGLSTKAAGGSYAMAAKHHDVFLWVLDAMGGDLEARVYEDQIVRPLVELNFGKSYSLPHFKFKPLSHEDRIKILTSFYTAVEKGVLAPTEEDAKWVRSILEAPESDAGGKDKKPAVPGFRPEEDPPPGNGKPGDGDEPAFGVIEYNALNRKLKSYELKTDFTLIEKTLDGLEEFAIDSWKGIARDQLDNILGAVRSRKLVERRNYDGVDKLQLRYVGDVNKLLRRTLSTAYANAQFQAWRETKDRTEKMEFTVERYGAEILMEPVEPKEAIAFFKRKGLLIDPASFKPYDRNAYRITGVESKTLLAKAQAIVTRGIRKGDALWTEAQLKKLFDKYIETGKLRPDGLLSKAYHIETVVRNNISEAYNYGRLEAFHHPDLVDEIEGYWYSAVLDDATTDYCVWMDEHSPFTKEEFEKEGPPPAHHRCRATFGAIVRGETWQSTRLSTPAGVMRGEGFCMHERRNNYAAA